MTDLDRPASVAGSATYRRPAARARCDGGGNPIEHRFLVALGTGGRLNQILDLIRADDRVPGKVSKNTLG